MSEDDKTDQKPFDVEELLKALPKKASYAMTEETERSRLLEDARKVVCCDREIKYGFVEDNFWDIARMWGVYLGVDLERRDVANMMILLKVARNNHAHPDDLGHRDNWVDIAGYAACGAEVDE